MIHISKISNVTERKDVKGDPVPFSFKAVTLKGEVIMGNNCIVTSSYSVSRTRNIRFLDSGQIRKVYDLSFLEINGVEVTL